MIRHRINKLIVKSIFKFISSVHQNLKIYLVEMLKKKSTSMNYVQHK